MHEAEISDLARQVQHNCHISDAHHGGNYSLCIYLLKMREFYRWEQGYNYAHAIPKEEVGDWLAEREALWESCAEESDYRPLSIAGQHFEAFDHDAINEQINPAGLVYNAGLGLHGAAHFVLARLESEQEHDRYHIRISGKELARDLTSPPAMSRDTGILVRRESLRRSLWERVDGWNWNRPKNAMSRALASYPWQDDIDKALERMTEDQLESVVQHEIGEVLAGQQLGEQWQDMVWDSRQTGAEIVLRAIRDHLADALTTLPGLIARQDGASLHMYIANLNNMRKHIYPALLEAYEQWLDEQDWTPLNTLVEDQRETWLQLARHALQHYAQHRETASPNWQVIAEWADSRRVHASG